MRRRDSGGTWDDVEFFSKKGQRVANPKITITDNFTIIFNSAFSFRAKLEDKEAVMFGYSRNKNAIILDFTEDTGVSGAFKLVHRGSGATVGSRSFCNSYDLKKEKIAGSYIPCKEKIPKVGEVWVIKLNEKITK